MDGGLSNSEGGNSDPKRIKNWKKYKVPPCQRESTQSTRQQRKKASEKERREEK